jgi:hypothetical protein
MIKIVQIIIGILKDNVVQSNNLCAYMNLWRIIIDCVIVKFPTSLTTAIIQSNHDHATII